jgi:hypothetical protein
MLGTMLAHRSWRVRSLPNDARKCATGPTRLTVNIETYRTPRRKNEKGHSMYSTLAILKKGQSFRLDEIKGLLVDSCDVMGQELSLAGNRLSVDGVFHVEQEDGSDVLSESDEIAKRYGLAAAGATTRFALWADDDPDMDYFNTWLMLVERLQKTNKFVFFDSGVGGPLDLGRLPT